MGASDNDVGTWRVRQLENWLQSSVTTLPQVQLMSSVRPGAAAVSWETNALQEVSQDLILLRLASACLRARGSMADDAQLALNNMHLGARRNVSSNGFVSTICLLGLTCMPACGFDSA